MTAAVPPALSAILITPNAFDRLQRTIAALQTQTVSDQIELVLVAPELPARPLAEGTLACFHGHQVFNRGFVEMFREETDPTTGVPYFKSTRVSGVTWRRVANG